MSARQYITTAIDYPNAAPHMGHVLEKVLADVCARWMRLRGDAVRFQIGTDEHGVKIARKAKEEGVMPQELVDRNVPLFQDLYGRLQISYDAFVRTTDRKRHWPTVEALWRKLQEAGKLEKRSYTGLYCSGCERFLTKKDLEDGKCVTHKVAPEEVTEENWFFTLGEDALWLKKLLTKKGKGGYTIVPEFRAPETLMLIEQGLEDVSFSRSRESLTWGIPVPDDPDHVMYVWCDALTNYISGLGFFTNHEDRTFWDDAQVTHVIGKDIARFHALIWPAMLKAANVRTPDTLLIHGFLTSEGEKMSKSLGNVVNPEDVLSRFSGNPDPLRFYLSHEVPVGRDGDFSWERITELYDSALRNQLGNLLNRILVMLKKESGALQIDSKASDAKQVAEKWASYTERMDGFTLHEGIKLSMEWVRLMNEGFNDAAPWKIKDDAKQKVSVLSAFAEYVRHVALMLLPFIPQTAQEISRQLNVPYAEKMLEKDFVITPAMREWGSQKDWRTVGEPKILFAPLE
ncbi:methionine--tRNA ligase [Candidatus Peregrinibacteria bacterium CG10_big_fil_rev_8_21_14_0_10_55_24]|nr:MAG: methionine--tRNA ligase [Candidatus Peregrinibacteria bacterium CG10_big_fil_rev_8_21_14_0_10_55_24]